MQLGVFVLAAILGVAAADFCCSHEDRLEVEKMWNDIWSSQFTGRRIKVAGAVFDDLFERRPEARSLFERVDVEHPESAAFKAHMVRVVNGLDTSINLLEDPAVLSAQLEHLHAQHAERKGVHEEHFDLIAESFHKVMPQITNCFNAEAWDRCFNLIAHGISHDL